MQMNNAYITKYKNFQDFITLQMSKKAHIDILSNLSLTNHSRVSHIKKQFMANGDTPFR